MTGDGRGVESWWMAPDADEDRPLTVEQAAEWLQLTQQGYDSPCATLRDWAARGRIDKAKLGNRVVFTLRILRTHVRGSAGGDAGAKEAQPTQAPKLERVLDVPLPGRKRKASHADVRTFRQGAASGGSDGDAAGADDAGNIYGSAAKLRLAPG